MYTFNFIQSKDAIETKQKQKINWMKREKKNIEISINRSMDLLLCQNQNIQEKKTKIERHTQRKKEINNKISIKKFSVVWLEFGCSFLFRDVFKSSHLKRMEKKQHTTRKPINRFW